MNHSNRIMRANESTATGVPIAMPRLVVELDVGVVVGVGVGVGVGFGTESWEMMEDESDDGVTVIVELEAFFFKARKLAGYEDMIATYVCPPQRKAYLPYILWRKIWRCSEW